jgi:hypothetical protein
MGPDFSAAPMTDSYWRQNFETYSLAVDCVIAGRKGRQQLVAYDRSSFAGEESFGSLHDLRFPEPPKTDKPRSKTFPARGHL